MVIGCVAFAGLVLAFAIFAYHRHQLRHAESAALGRSNVRSMTLDEDDDDTSGPNTRFIGAVGVSGAPLYDRLRGGNTLDSPGEGGGINPSGDARGQDDAGGGSLPPIATISPIGEGEAAILMHPANRSAADFSDFDTVPLSPPKSPALSDDAYSSPIAGPSSSEWLGGHPASNAALPPGSPQSVGRLSPVARPVSPSSVYSDDMLPNHKSVRSPDIPPELPAAALGGLYASRSGSISSHGHGEFASGPGSSAHGHGPGSSSGGNGSSIGHKSSGVGYMSGPGSSGSHQARAPLLPRARPQPPPVPSSLLPTQRKPPDLPPSAQVDDDDDDDDRRSRVSGLIGRSLRGFRRRSARASVTSLGTITQQQQAISPTASTVLLASPRPTLEQSRPTSIYRPQSPTLAGALPPPIPKGALPPAMPGARTAWSGLLLGPLPEPSPALTEGSSMHAPEGLLDPRLGLLGVHGMQSQGAISFRDDMDYSRPIGGVSCA